MDNQETKTALTFPCDFPIKIVGAANPEFELAALSIIRHHVAELKETAIRTRPSKDGKYLALTVLIQAQSQEQLDNIYRELTACELVLMTL